jgi:hypothetical protein
MRFELLSSRHALFQQIMHVFFVQVFQKTQQILMLKFISDYYIVKEI